MSENPPTTPPEVTNNPQEAVPRDDPAKALRDRLQGVDLNDLSPEAKRLILSSWNSSTGGEDGKVHDLSDEHVDQFLREAQTIPEQDTPQEVAGAEALEGKEDERVLTGDELAAAVAQLQNGVGSLPPVPEEEPAVEAPAEQAPIEPVQAEEASAPEAEKTQPAAPEKKELSNTEVLGRVIAPYIDGLNAPVVAARDRYKGVWKAEQAASERRKALLKSRSQWAAEGLVSAKEINALSDEAVNAIFDEAIAARSGLADDEVKAIDWSVKSPKSSGEVDRKWQAAREDVLKKQLGSDEELFKRVNDFITEDKKAYLEENKDDPKASKWSFPDAAVMAMMSVESDEGQPVVAPEWREANEDNAALDDDALVRIVRGARKMQAEKRKAERKNEVAETTSAPAQEEDLPRKRYVRDEEHFVTDRARVVESIAGNDAYFNVTNAYIKAQELDYKNRHEGSLNGWNSNRAIIDALEKNGIVGTGGFLVNSSGPEFHRLSRKETVALWNDITAAHVAEDNQEEQTVALANYINEAAYKAQSQLTEIKKYGPQRTRAFVELGIIGEDETPSPRVEKAIMARALELRTAGVDATSETTGASESSAEKVQPYDEKLAEVKSKIAEIRQQFSNQAFKDEGEKSAKRAELQALVDEERNLEENADELKQQDTDRQLDADLEALGYAGKTDEDARLALRTKFGNLWDKNSDEARKIRATLGGLNSRIERVNAAEREAIGVQADALAAKLGITNDGSEGREPLPTSLNDPAGTQSGREPLPVSLDDPADTTSGREPLPTSLDDPAGNQSGREPLPTSLDDPAGTAAENLTEPSREELKALRESLEEEYYALPLEERNSEQGKDLRRRMNEAYQREHEVDMPQPEANPHTNETIRAEISPEKQERLRAALAAYAEIRARNEHKEEGIFRRFGRKGRETELREAAKELREAKLDIENYIVERKAALGLYEGDEEAIRVAKSDELFEGLLSLDEESRAATLEIHANRAENRNKFQKALIAFGGWLQKGKKVTRVAKQGGIGFGLGAAKGGILAVTGTTIPVSIAIGAGAGAVLAGVRYGVNKNVIDAARAADKNAEGKVERRLSNEQIAKLKSIIEGTTQTYYQNVTALAESVLQTSEQYSKEQLKKARRKAAGVMGVMGAGMALGGITTFGGNLLYHNLHDNVPTGGTPSGKGPSNPLEQTKPHDVDARSKLLYPEHHLKGNSFFVEPGNGPIREIQQAARANGHPVSMGRAEAIYDHMYDKFGDKLVTGGPEYHGPNGDLRFGESGKYRWGKGVLEDIVEMAAK